MGLIVDYVAQAEQHPDVKALIVTGQGEHFVRVVSLKTSLRIKEMLETIYSGFLSIANCTLPTIAAINGAGCRCWF